MKISRINKLYISNFLTGLVFWYGIEKLFMRSIGIDAIGVGAATSVFLVFSLIFDIPAGILADRWSRKYVLAIAAIALGLCSFIMGRSHGLAIYAFGEIFYGIYIVSTSGTYNAIIYDSLHEEGRAEKFSKISGQAYALFLVGAGVANIASGFISSHFGYRDAYLVTILPCVINVLVILSIKEPVFHKSEKKEQVLKHLKEASIAINKIKLLQCLTIILTALSVSDLFQSEFGQLYMLRYFSSPEVIGVLWAIFAFCWSFGSLIAYRFRNQLNLLILCSVAPFVLMSFIDNWFSIVLFMFQVVASAAFFNQTETRIQENTPSSLRASIMSVVNTLARAVSIPASFVLGWLFHEYNALWALRFVAVISILILIYYWSVRSNIPRANKSDTISPRIGNDAVI